MMLPITQLSALRWIMLVIFAAWSTAGQAVGLGPLQLQSWLGQPLQAMVPLVGEQPDALASLCVKAKLESTEGDFVASLQAALIHEPQTGLRLTSPQTVSEPVMALSVSIGCGMPVKRTYQVLLDPPLTAPMTAALDRAPAAAAAPKAEPSRAAALPVIPPVAPQQLNPDHARPARRNPASLQIARQMPVRPKRAAQTSRAVLKLSSSEPEVNFDLKLSSSLSESALAADSQNAQKIRAARLHFAALLNDEDPLRDAETQARSARERLQILQVEIDLLKERSQIDQAKLNELQKKPDLSLWIVALAALLLASVAALIWLAWRPKAAPQRTRSNWWETVSPNEYDDPRTLDPEPPRAKPARAPATPQSDIDFAERRFEPRAAKATAPLSFRTEERDDNYPFHLVPSGSAANARPAASDHIEIAKVEEISDVLQEVEFWTLLNDRARVLEILEPLAKVEQPDSPAPWLYLLDIYREMQEPVKYEVMRERFMRFFNVNILRWEELCDGETLRSLEDFPHVLEQISNRWQQPGIVAFLESLLLDDRDGTREGFDLPVYRELMMLISVAQELQKFPIPPAAAAL